MFLLIFSIFITATVSQKFDNPMLQAFQQQITEFLENNGNLSTIIDVKNNIESNVKFFVLWRTTGYMDYLLVPGNAELLRSSPFDMNKDTKILIHGFFDSIHGEMITELMNSYLTSMDVNVIAVDWSAVAYNIDYIDVAIETRSVGEFVANMIDFLVKEGYDINRIHIVGHSLGAHVSGSAGNSVTTGRVPRITGLDPALPGFEEISIARRLSKDDALFVDCIHTSGNLLGIYGPFCHADFYPNKGTHPQPGCPFMDFGRCSHFRAFRYFAESVLKNHVFPSLRCASVNSNCELTSVKMGNFLNSTTRGIYCGFTKNLYPFAPDLM